MKYISELSPGAGNTGKRKTRVVNRFKNILIQEAGFFNFLFNLINDFC